MTNANYAQNSPYKNLVPRTLFPQVSGNIVIPLVAPNSNIVKFTANLRNISATTGASGTLVKFIAGATLSFTLGDIRNTFVPPATLSANLSTSANNLTTIYIAGTDEAAGLFTAIEITIYNWNQASKKYGTLKVNLPSSVSANAKQAIYDFIETTATPFDGFYFTWGAKTPDANSYYQIDQLG